MALATSQRRNPDALSAQRIEGTKLLAALQVESASIDGLRKLARRD
jgi:hypothetical protein